VRLVLSETAGAVSDGPLELVSLLLANLGFESVFDVLAVLEDLVEVLSGLLLLLLLLHEFHLGFDLKVVLVIAVLGL